MSNPPHSPPSKGLEGRDRDKPSTEGHAAHAAEQEEQARKHSKGRPADAKR